MKPKWILALLAAVMGVGLYSSTVLATPSTVTTTILAKSRFADIDLKAHSTPASLWRAKIETHGSSDVYVVDNKLAAKTATTPGGTTGWHSHPGPSLIQVVAGTVTNYEGDDPSCTPHVYTAGMGFVDAGGNDVHMLVNEGSVPAETIAVQLLPQDAVRRIDAPDPGNCPH
jgi:quercetin dioxygenase-like cupin family protein